MRACVRACVRVCMYVCSMYVYTIRVTSKNVIANGHPFVVCF